MDIDSLELGLEPQIADAGVRLGYLAIVGLDNQFHDKWFMDTYKELQQNIVHRESLKTLLADPQILGYRKLHEMFDVTETAMIPSPESIFRILFTRKTLRSISLIVDIYNYISLKFRISVGAHDMKKLSRSVQLGVTRHDDRFLPLGSNRSQSVPVGEYAYRDGDGEILCRLECRQSDRTKIEPGSQEVLFIFQGHIATPTHVIPAAIEELKSLLGKYCGPYTKERMLFLPDTLSHAS